jgi:opacity protein-like surface antigen
MGTSQRACCAGLSAAAICLAAFAAQAQERGAPAVSITASNPEPGTEPASTAPSAPVGVSKTNLQDGWQGPWALLFSLNNIFQVAQILNGYQGFGIGGQYHLDPDTAIRGGASLNRTSTPQEVSKTTTIVGDDKTSQFTVQPGSASLTGTLGVDYLRRLSRGLVAPYAGGGVFVGLGRATTNLEDDLSAEGQLHTTSSRDQSAALGVRGILGATWRVHESFAFFAEYALALEMWRWHQFRSTDTREDTAAGSTLRTRNARETTRLLNFAVGLSQGASFGLCVFFD